MEPSNHYYYEVLAHLPFIVAAAMSSIAHVRWFKCRHDGMPLFLISLEPVVVAFCHFISLPLHYKDIEITHFLCFNFRRSFQFMVIKRDIYI